jgi:hypothetical protein
MTMQLLLAHAEERPAVPRPGMPVDTLRSAPKPGNVELPKKLWDATRDPNELTAQRWGLVAPNGSRGDRLLAIIEPLRQLRQQGQGGAPVKIYRVPSVMTGPFAAKWKQEVFRDEKTSEQNRPRYLLLLGDLHEVPLELQQALSTDAFVGRLAFRTDAGYEAYVEKVLKWEGAAARETKPRVIFYTSRDRTDATEVGHQALVTPSVRACRERQEVNDFPKADILEFGGEGAVPIDTLLTQAAHPEPGVLFTLSHGRGPPAGGWAKPEDRPKHQGELRLPDGEFLPAEELASRPFLPGGVWFSFACFSAGTPSHSSYTHWLRQLPPSDSNARKALEALPPLGEQPFIAALPQAALANPNGPLAVMGHVDLAWTCSFKHKGRSTPSRYIELLKALAGGSRAGVALSTLLQFLNEASSELATSYNMEELERTYGKRSSIDLVDRAWLWMQRQDLANYILLGDPAVRLPLASAQKQPPAPERRVDAQDRMKHLLGPQFKEPGPGPRGPSPMQAEKAILELLTGQGQPEQIAARHELSPGELLRWEKLYRDAGREALARHLSTAG